MHCTALFTVKATLGLLTTLMDCCKLSLQPLVPVATNLIK